MKELWDGPNALIKRAFTSDGNDWFYAQASDEFEVRFLAPVSPRLNIGDAVLFPPFYPRGPVSTMAFLPAKDAIIPIKGARFKDLRQLLAKVTFRRSRTQVRLYAKGHVEVDGMFNPGNTSVFIDIDHLKSYVSSPGIQDFWLKDPRLPGSKELRVSALDWFTSKVIPRLKEAEKRYRRRLT